MYLLYYTYYIMCAATGRERFGRAHTHTHFESARDLRSTDFGRPARVLSFLVLEITTWPFVTARMCRHQRTQTSTHTHTFGATVFRIPMYTSFFAAEPFTGENARPINVWWTTLIYRIIWPQTRSARIQAARRPARIGLCIEYMAKKTYAKHKSMWLTLNCTVPKRHHVQLRQYCDLMRCNGSVNYLVFGRPKQTGQDSSKQ